MEISGDLDQNNPCQMVAQMRHELLHVLGHEEASQLVLQRQHESKVEQLLEQCNVAMCGNFYVEPVKDGQQDYQLEREIIDQNLHGYFIMHLDRLSDEVCVQFTRLFKHIITEYAYRTRRPLVEQLEYRGELLLRQLCLFLLDKPRMAFFAAEMLQACCQHEPLARRLVDLCQDEESKPFYIQLFQSVSDNHNFDYLMQTFKYLNALLLSHVTITNYAFSRDLGTLIAVFNQIFHCTNNYYARFRTLGLFARLVQNRYLQSLINSYTTSLTHLELFYRLMTTADRENRTIEFIKSFEVLRLFILNPNNEKNDSIKQFVEKEYMTLVKSIEKSQQIRSYTDVTLSFSEYQDVFQHLDQLAGKAKSNSSRTLNSPSSDSL